MLFANLLVYARDCCVQVCCISTMEPAMFIPLSTQRFSPPASEFSPGPAPFLEWIEINKLVVDVTYQREIGRRGATNVNQIAENFDWSKFAPWRQ
jgi:hypothetical protein